MVRIFNERGAVLYGAHITKRMMPGVVRAPNGGGYDPLKIGELGRGTINTITPLKTLSKNCAGMVVNAFLVEVEKWKGES